LTSHNHRPPFTDRRPRFGTFAFFHLLLSFLNAITSSGFVVLRAGRHRQASATLPGVRNAAA
jgi:hypothetical protein